MLRNYLITAVRNLFKNKLTTLINIFGLSLGITSSLLIFLYSQSELTYNSNHKNADHIFQVYKERHIPTGMQITRDTWYPMAEALKSDYPEIKAATHLWDEESWIQIGEKKYKENITYARQNLFDVFTFPTKYGDTKTPLKEIHSAVLSKETAVKLFGTENPVGSTFIVNNDVSYTVSAVLDEIPDNTTYRPAIILPSNSMPWYNNVKNLWGSSWLDTYVLLKDNVSPKSLEAKFPSFVNKTWGDEGTRLKLKLTNLKDLYNDTTGSNEYAYILLVIAFSIILIASINFMNLSNAKSLERLKEVGVRKVLGASKRQLIFQFLSESLIVSLLSIIIGIVFASILLPIFNRLYEIHLSIFSGDYILRFSGLILLGIIIGITSGIYPAVVISKFKPSETVKSLRSNVKGLSFRNILLVTQFAISFILIIGTLIIGNQINYMKNANLNFDKDNLIAIPVSSGDFKDGNEGIKKIEVFKNELLKYSNIKNVSASSFIPGSERGSFSFVYPNDRPEEQRLRQRFFIIDENYVDVFGLKIEQGRNFSADFETDKSDAVMMNEAALKDIGWKSINDGFIIRGKTNRKIVGLIKDFNYQSLENPIGPVVFFFRSLEDGSFNYLTVKVSGNNIPETLNYIKSKWSIVDPSREFDYFFVDRNIESLYSTQERLSKAAGVFSGFAIIIACLGLFAMSSLIITRKTKEIGVRKVLGASEAQIVELFVKHFAVFVVIAFVIASPITYYLLSKWQNDFAYKNGIEISSFVIGGILVLLTALITVGIKAVKAATTNPAKSLKYE